MREMRRLGGGTQPTTGQPRRAYRAPERQGLAGLATQVQERTVAAVMPEPPAEPANGGNGKTADAGANKAAARPAAAQMPNGPGISDERRKLRLLDRLTGLSKS
jgi:hypothetical protein